jgi:hypothetical protein
VRIWDCAVPGAGNFSAIQPHCHHIPRLDFERCAVAGEVIYTVEGDSTPMSQTRDALEAILDDCYHDCHLSAMRYSRPYRHISCNAALSFLGVLWR